MTGQSRARQGKARQGVLIWREGDMARCAHGVSIFALLSIQSSMRFVRKRLSFLERRNATFWMGVTKSRSRRVANRAGEVVQVLDEEML